MKVYDMGKDQNPAPCIELEDGFVRSELEILGTLINLLIKDGITTKEKLIDELTK